MYTTITVGHQLPRGINYIEIPVLVGEIRYSTYPVNTYDMERYYLAVKRMLVTLPVAANVVIHDCSASMVVILPQSPGLSAGYM